MESLTNITNASSVSSAAPATDPGTRVREIRSRLPGQVIAERVEMARLGYGPLYSLDAIRARVAATLPWRGGFARHAEMERIETYREKIPDEPLLKYDDARTSGLFSEFSVATPAYHREPQTDPWIVGRVTGTELYAVIAQWE